MAVERPKTLCHCLRWKGKIWSQSPIFLDYFWTVYPESNWKTKENDSVVAYKACIICSPWKKNESVSSHETKQWSNRLKLFSLSKHWGICWIFYEFWALLYMQFLTVENFSDVKWIHLLCDPNGHTPHCFDCCFHVLANNLNSSYIFVRNKRYYSAKTILV